MPTAQAVHSRLYRSKGAAKSHPCVGCGKTARDWAYQYPKGGPELADASGQRFSESMEDYAPMCRACHVAFDAEKDPAQKLRRDVAARSVDRATRKRVGDAFAERLKADPEFSREMEVVRGRATRLGGAATAARFRDDPEFRAERSAALLKASRRRYRCVECGYESTAGPVARHQRKTNHTERGEAPDAR